MKTKVYRSFKNAVLGSPIQPGQFVKVITLTDSEANKEFLGKIGKVIKLGYDPIQRYPDDPMIYIEHETLEISGFWKEELEIIR